ncbi:hypothetical protein JAAARDRAFT_33311 [Jaapia argillacea MUCL 33604]|uniref:DUF6699 domain-containing protein n=1 Tax=Jaapia argillacea MUCL 33604 TaxID=933084 RepID=A0A067Q8B2_9AGAM|nr:hypothetical protein JAAARDRAFT_33311 [Jaapia argillacea MUCL 33604]
MADQVGKWSAGPSYGPVLSTTDLYLLNSELQLNPVLTNQNKAFHLVFNLSTGQTGGFNPDAQNRDLPFACKDEPATLPRVEELILITEYSPWCTIVSNKKGVTLGDICSTIWKDYTDNMVTDAELASLPPRLQEQMRRTAAHNQANQPGGNGWNMYYSPAPTSIRLKRVDWLRERVYFEGLSRKDSYAVSRLGYKAPNIFVIGLSS